MGGIFAKLDNQDKIISLEKRTILNVKEEYNLNMDKLKEYYNKYGYLKVEINEKEMEKYIDSYIKKYLKKSEKKIAGMKAAIGMQFNLSIALSNYGLFVLYENSVEKFSAFEAFENDHYGGYELFSDTGKKDNLKHEKLSVLTVLIPKIYFTEERNGFIDFLISGLPKKESSEQKQILLITKKILNKINETANPEVKIANTIGLITRINILQFAIDLAKTQYSNEESIEILSELVNEHLDDIPNDECTFYNDKLNFIKFTPNICVKAKEEKELILKKIYETTCPVQEEKVCPVQEEKVCPVQEEKVCPVQEEIKCPDCGEKKCPQHICAACVKEECPKPEEPSNLWKYTSVLLTIIVIILVFVMIFGSSGTKSNVKNLSKLN